jgi:hypothetical protein
MPKTGHRASQRKSSINGRFAICRGDKAIARFCEVIADYGLPIPTDMRNSQPVAEQSEWCRAQSTGGVLADK